jgi:5-methylcytosine-specific restriction endonuclease McrA
MSDQILQKFRRGLRAYLTIKCEACSDIFERQERVYLRQSRNPNLCKVCSSRLGRTAQAKAVDHKCEDCGTQIWRGAQRCKPCAAKHRTPFENRRVACFCAECSTEVWHGSIRCLSCHNEKQDEGKSKARTLFNVSQSWRKARTACFERDNYTCQNCGDRGGYLHAHHVRSYAEHPESRLDVDNLTTMCRDCHSAHHGLTKKRAG